MSKTLLFLFVISFTQSCFGEMAQEINISGYPSTTPSSSSSVTKINPPVVTVKTPMPVPATDGELQQLIQSVDLSMWSEIATYLWTCTPRYFTVPMFDAKNEIQARFNQFKQKKIILTKEGATQISTALAQPVSFRIPGLSGIMCRINLAVSNVEEPYTLTCLFIMLDARYLSRLVYDVSENNGKAEVVPQDTVNAIQKLFDANCTKQT